MEEVSTNVLTRFIINCMSSVLEGRTRPVSKPVIPATNVQQFSLADDRLGLKYLETVTQGAPLDAHHDIRIFQQDGSGLVQIWGMQIDTHPRVNELIQVNIGLYDIRNLLIQSRLNGFRRTLARMRAGEMFSLLDIPARREPAAVGKDGTPGYLVYSANNDHDIARSQGGELIRFEPEQGFELTALLFTTSYNCRRF